MTYSIRLLSHRPMALLILLVGGIIAPDLPIPFIDLSGIKIRVNTTDIDKMLGKRLMSLS